MQGLAEIDNAIVLGLKVSTATGTNRALLAWIYFYGAYALTYVGACLRHFFEEASKTSRTYPVREDLSEVQLF